jgi:transposase
MNKRLLSDSQIADLLKNPNVAKCSPKSISYSQAFKIWAVRQYEENGRTATQIFKEAGFDLVVIGKDKPKEQMKLWRKIYKAKGYSGLEIDGRGRTSGCLQGRPKTKGVSDAYKIKYLETQVAYLKAENDFLAKLRAGKAE